VSNSYMLLIAAAKYVSLSLFLNGNSAPTAKVIRGLGGGSISIDCTEWSILIVNLSLCLCLCQRVRSTGFENFLPKGSVEVSNWHSVGYTCNSEMKYGISAISLNFEGTDAKIPKKISGTSTVGLR